MTKIKDVVLQFPCPVGKKSLRKIKEGYYCNKCDTNVVDFSDKSSEVLKCEIRQSQNPVCGIFKKSQLNSQFVKYAAATLFVSSAFAVQTIAQDKAKLDSDSASNANLDQEESVFFGLIVEVPTTPVGGISKFMNALSRELRYPKKFEGKGKCFVEFLIDTTGRAHDYKIIKSLNEEADQEAIRALTQLNYPWTPGKQRGKPVVSRFIIPISFDPDKEKK